MEEGLCTECGGPVEAGRNTCGRCADALISAAKPSRASRLLPSLILGLIVVPLAFIFIVLPVSRSSVNRGSRHQGMFTSCRSNLKNIGTALEMYTTDFKGLYPVSLDRVTPGYLRQLPTCPAGGETYAGGYVRAVKPDAYTVVCTGHHHEEVGQSANYPQYSSNNGLIER